MSDLFLVERGKGPSWDHSKGRREQPGWEDHAAFMDGLAEEGVIVLGGPIGGAEGEYTALVLDLPDEAAVRARLGEDPWGEDMLTLVRVEPWLVWLRSSREA